MKLRHLGVSALALFLLSAGTEPSWAAPPLTGRTAWVVETLETWIASGTDRELPLPSVMTAAIRNLPEKGVPLAPGSEPELRLLVHTDDPDALRRAGLTVRTVAGSVVTVTAPLSRMDAFAGMPGVRRVEIPRPVEPMLDVSVPEVNADQVHGASQPPYPQFGVTGAGVVIGIVDTGIDYDHGDFRNGSTSRITRIWDQTDSGGPAAAGFGYGTEWTQGAIEAGTARERDTDGHGTHVTGIAAANGSASSYTFVGTAPEAEIMFVKTDFLEDSIIDAVNWVQTRAGSKPAVVNLSLGSQFGPHDGTSDLDVAMNGLSGPGRIIVSAAGNDRGNDIHAQAEIAGIATEEIRLSINSYTAKPGANNDLLFLDGWYPGTASFDITVVSPSGHTVGPVGPNQIQSLNSADGTIRVEQLLGSNGDRGVLIDIWDSTANPIPPKSGTWRIQVENNGGTSREIDLWVSFNRVGQAFTWCRWTNFLDESELITTPGSADSVIAVGAYVTKILWNTPTGQCSYQPPPSVGNYAPFSSPGPRRDGGQKPEISAPGMGIASTLSSDATNPTFTQGCARAETNIHAVSQGTSQATPHVTGTVALLLQLRPEAAYREIADRITQTARHDILTGAGFSNDFGWGKLDAEAAALAIVPVRLLAMSADWEDGRAVVRWNLAETEAGAQFRVERGPSESGPFHDVSGPIRGETSFAWIDPDPIREEPYYRVIALTRDGGVDRFGPVRLDSVAGSLRVFQNAPNPFSGSTVIAFELDQPRDVAFEVIDIRGRLVHATDLGRMGEGPHRVEWNGTESGGRPAAAGVYFYRIRTDSAMLVRRMVLAR